MVPTCLNSEKTHALGSQLYWQSLAILVLWNSGIVTERRRSQQCKNNSTNAPLLHFPTHTGWKPDIRGGKGAAAQGSSMQRITKDCWHMQVLVGTKWPIRQWLWQFSSGLDMTIYDFSKRVCTETTPHSKFCTHGIYMDTGLVLISSRSLNTTRKAF